MNEPVFISDEVEINCSFVNTVYPPNNASRSRIPSATWMVVKYAALETGKRFSAAGINLPTVSGIEILLRGSWSANPRYGRTLEVSSHEIIVPRNEQGFLEYIDFLRVGIGKTRAKALYAAYREGIWEALESEPEKAASLSGIPLESIERLRDARKHTQIQRDLCRLFGRNLELTPARTQEIALKAGTDAAEWILENPYRLTEISGFGFKAVDRFALHLGIAPDAPARLAAGIEYCLADAASRGNTCIPKNELQTQMQHALKQDDSGPTISESAIREALNEAWRSGSLVICEDMAYSRARFEQETSLIQDLLRILQAEQRLSAPLENILAAYEKEAKIRLAASQRKAVENVFRHKATIVTGGPGTGKTTIIRAILYAHQQIYGKKSAPVFLSSTGRAARRMTEATGFPAQTIHSAVSYIGETEEEPPEATSIIEGNLFVVDESSMMDLYIASVLLRKIPSDARVVFVGDPDQLPSVGCGNVLSDMIASGVLAMTRLGVIFRQNGESPIVTNAAKIRNGDTALIISEHFCVLKEASTADVFRKACGLYYKCVKKYGIDNVVLLNPYRDKSDLNVNVFNRNLQHLLNPPQEGIAEMARDRSLSFRPGDKVMQMRNTESARNGDTGYILRIERSADPDAPQEELLQAVVEFNHDGIEHVYTRDTIRDLDLAYCTTIHKSQGSEYQAVIMVLSAQHKAMLRRNLIYTGVTRAKESVAIITEEEKITAGGKGNAPLFTAVEAAIQNNKTDKRNSLLGLRLKTAAESLKQ